MTIEEFFNLLNKLGINLLDVSVDIKEKIYSNYLSKPNHKVIFDKVFNSKNDNIIFNEMLYINYYYLIEDIANSNFLINDILDVLYIKLSTEKFFDLITQEIDLKHRNEDYKKINILGNFLFFKTNINFKEEISKANQVYIFQNSLLFASVLYLEDKTTEINKLYSIVESSLIQEEKEKFKKILLDRINSFIFIA